MSSSGCADWAAAADGATVGWPDAWAATVASAHCSTVVGVRLGGLVGGCCIRVQSGCLVLCSCVRVGGDDDDGCGHNIQTIKWKGEKRKIINTKFM